MVKSAPRDLRPARAFASTWEGGGREAGDLVSVGKGCYKGSIIL